MLLIDPDWNPVKDTLNLRNHYEPLIKNNPKFVCTECGKRHFPDEETYILIYGNITVGLTGGIIRNNFSSDGKLKRVSIFCRNKRCLGILNERLLDTTNDENDEVEDDITDDD